MNLSPSVIVAYIVTVLLLILLMVGFGPQAGLAGIFIMGLSFFIGASTEATAKK